MVCAWQNQQSKLFITTILPLSKKKSKVTDRGLDMTYESGFLCLSLGIWVTVVNLTFIINVKQHYCRVSALALEDLKPCITGL